jgi:hypothetical protein
MGSCSKNEFFFGVVAGVVFTLLLVAISFPQKENETVHKTGTDGPLVSVEIPGKKTVAGFVQEVGGKTWVTFPSDTMNMEGVRVRFSETSTAPVYPDVDSVVVRVGPRGGIIP